MKGCLLLFLVLIISIIFFNFIDSKYINIFILIAYSIFFLLYLYKYKNNKKFENNIVEEKDTKISCSNSNKEINKNAKFCRYYDIKTAYKSLTEKFKFINKKHFYYFITAILIIILFVFGCIITNLKNQKLAYSTGLKCFENKDWHCVIENFTELNYKDSDKKLKIAQYENYIIKGNNKLKNKLYSDALYRYKKALELQPNNKELKIKIDSLEILANKEQKDNAIRQKQQEEVFRKNEIKTKISDTAIYQIPTKFGQGYDETIKRYGITTINRINKLAPKAAELVAQNPNCTKVIAIDVADDKSTRNSLTFFADCGDIDNIRDIQRFYVNEKEIKENAIPKSIKEQAKSIDNGQYILMCEAEIKARLNFPSTYKANIISSRVLKASLNTVVTVPFKAKNAHNLELKNKGTCYYNGTTLTDINIQEEL